MRARLALALPLLAAACSTPAPPPRIAAPLPVVVPPLPPAVPTDWRDKPYTPGLWRYADHTASFGPAGTAPLLTMRCDIARRLVVISVLGTVATLTIRTSYAEKNWPAQAGSDGRSALSFAPSDPSLDQIAFSRGRFSISGPGLAEIDIPAWAEPARVIEDCRG
ncbi:MAG TPA: hypothetical protein VNT42_03360 [Sphingomonas sp.]|nr:hypothetical protein [Sphingomonas sp.]